MNSLTIVRAYALACAQAAKDARDELDATIDRLVAARTEAEAALERCNASCEYAERISAFAARAMAGDVDPETLAEAAAAIEQLVGPMPVKAA